MPTYLVSATNDAGKRKTVYLDAPNANHAVEQLANRGFRDIVLHTGDVDAQFSPGPDTRVSAKDALEIRNCGQTRYLWSLVRIKYRNSSLFVICGLFLACCPFIMGIPFRVANLAGVAIVLAPALLALEVYFRSTNSKRYDELCRELLNGKWKRVIELCNYPFPGSALIITEKFRSTALAKTGRVDDGVASFLRHCKKKDIPNWLVEDMTADIYRSGSQYDKAVECMRRAVEDAPENPSVLIDRAHLLLDLNQQVQTAEDLLLRARQQAMTELEESMASMVEGLLSIRKSEFNRAIDHLQSSRIGLMQLVNASHLVRALVIINDARLAQAYAHDGQTEKSKAIFDRIRPYLEVLQLNLVLNDCLQSLRQAGISL